MEITHRTPYVVGWTVLLDKRGAEELIAAVRGTWRVHERGALELLESQPPLQPTDLHVGEPGLSSVRYEADLGPMKPGTDCALIGHAVAPRGRVRRVDVSFRVGPVSRKATVIGERRRLFWFLRWWNSPAKAFERVPLVWELARGGSDATPKNPKHHSLDLKNPLGRGFHARGSKLRRLGAPLPQILNGRQPAGFGLTGGHWAHRRPYAGTYDEAWQKERCPLLPDDFDERFHAAAAPGLTTEKHLVGGEPVEAAGCTRSGKLTFRLPRVAHRLEIEIGGETTPLDLRIVTVTLDTDAMELRMLWRGAVGVHGRLLDFERLRLESTGGES